MANVKNNQELFETESGKYIMSIALKVSHMEKRLTKKASSKDLLDFYNRVYLLCEEFKKNINSLEQREGRNNE